MSQEKTQENLTLKERQLLLRLARRAIEAAAAGQPLPQIDLESLPERLREPRACFVTIHTKNGELRGCTGVLVARLPLAQEVIQTAAQTALRDPRFPPVTPEEVPELDIEISILTPPQPLHFSDPRELPRLIRPGIDGVTLFRGPYRATFLPQVWERISDPVEFLDMLSQKMGLPPRAWMFPGMQAEVYQVESFSEKELADEAPPPG